jgi:hypothetical protein
MHLFELYSQSFSFSILKSSFKPELSAILGDEPLLTSTIQHGNGGLGQPLNYTYSIVSTSASSSGGVMCRVEQKVAMRKGVTRLQRFG